jgi:protein subunit release factor B
MTIDEELARCEVSSRRSLGGQHTNGPDYSVRLTHPEYGFDVMVEYERERNQNLALAMTAMKTLLTYSGICKFET